MSDTKQNKLEYKDLTSYIISLPKVLIEKIFDHTTICLAIYRELPELAKIIVMRLLLLNQEVPKSTINSWVNSPYQKKNTESINILTNLSILQNVRTQGGMPALILAASFKRNLFSAVLGNSIGNTLAQVNDQTTQKSESELIEKLDNYATERWQSVLKYIVKPKENKKDTSISTKKVLKFAGLMKSTSTNVDDNDETDDSDSIVLTASAFQFLLWNRRLQLWYYIIQLLEYSKENSKDITECLSLLFELSFLTFGKAYSCENFSSDKEYFLQELRTIGLVYMKTRKEKKLYPTRLAIQLANGLTDNDDAMPTDETGYIIVETNYRVYAYTNSQLQISLLALFSELIYRFPNLVVAAITRERCREAFQMGITAHQIINFLRANAHPQSASKKPAIPVTVIDQINLWYEERDRFKYTDSVLYSQFNSEDDFQLLKTYAQSMDALIWHNDNKRIMIVKVESHDTIRKYWKDRKPKK